METLKVRWKDVEYAVGKWAEYVVDNYTVGEYLGYKYVGIELRREQIQANEVQANEMGLKPRWIVGDGENVIELTNNSQYDFLFSCPPYYDLEVYSDLGGELSAMNTYEEFLEKYKRVIKNSVRTLRDNRFACFVVSDIRDDKGYYRNFVSDTIRGFGEAGMGLYNEAILVNSIGSLPVRVGRYFRTRKLGRCHQNVLIFYKGDAKRIPEEFGEL